MFQVRATAIPVPSGIGHTLTRRELFMLPTRNGMLYALILLVLLIASVNYSNGLGYGLTFLLGSVAVVSMLHTHRTLNRLRLVSGSSPPVYAGQIATFTLLLLNDAPVARLGVVLHQDKREIARVDVPAGEATTVELHLPTTHRGYLSAPNIVVVTRFPLGLWYSWSRRLRLERDCLVYPAPAPIHPMSFGAGAEHGMYHSGDDFAGLRIFRPGDPPQHVAWKTVARGQGWYTKQFGGGAATSVWLDWDSLPGVHTEVRLQILCRWILDAQARGLRYGLRLPGIVVAPNIGSSHQHKCLEHLALFKS